MPTIAVTSVRMNVSDATPATKKKDIVFIFKVVDSTKSGIEFREPTTRIVKNFTQLTCDRADETISNTARGNILEAVLLLGHVIDRRHKIYGNDDEVKARVYE